MTALEQYIAEAIARRPLEAAYVRRIVEALDANGTPVVAVDDTEEREPVANADDVLNIVFNLDEAYLLTESGAWVRLVMGEYPDTICDYAVSLDPALDPLLDPPTR